MKQVKLEFNGSWVLEHRGDSKLPVDLFIDVFSAIIGGNISVSKSTLTECELLLNDSILTFEEIGTIVADILKNEFSIDKESDIAKYAINDFVNNDSPKKTEAADDNNI